MHSRFVIFILLFSSGAYCKSPLSPVRWAFGLGASAVYQQSRFNDPQDGLDIHYYQSKLQWLGEAKVRAYTDGIFIFGLSAGMRDAGWKMVNEASQGEPYWTKHNYSFLYAHGDLSVGMNCFKKLPQLYIYLGFIQQFNVSNREKTFFLDGHTEKATSHSINPNKFPNSAYLALEYAWNLNAHSVIGFQYKCEVGIKKYHEVIVRSPQIQHGLGVNYHFSL